MPADALEQLKRTAVFISGPDGTGSGYLVARGRVGTALHVVKSWQPGQDHDVLVGTGPAGVKCKARLLGSDPASDAAVLALDPVPDIEPLPVARRLDRRSAWEGYGFPGLASRLDAPPGLPIDGHVKDPSTVNDAGQPAVLLYSEMIAAGNASPLHGFSGSPVVVDGALVGHLVKHLGDPDDRRRAAFGCVYACPIGAVLALLDVTPRQRDIRPEVLRTVADAIPVLGPDEYHVFVSYRSTDRPWALSLVARLEGAGMRVFIDQRELQPGDSLAGQLASALQRSRAAVVLVSRGWIDSPWCRQEADILVKRAVEDERFRLVPLRLDDSAMPPTLDARVWLDFDGTRQAEGENVERLLDALLGRRRPGADTPAGKAEKADRALVDEFVARLRVAAAMDDARRVGAILDEWRATASTDAAPLIVASSLLISKVRHEQALDVLAQAPATVRARQLRALALSKSGRRDEAILVLETLQREGNLDPETGGLLAGRYKEHWLRSGDLGFRARSYQTYRDAYEKSGDPFVGINAASMALHCNDPGNMSRYAMQVVESLLKRPSEELDHWNLASIGEGYLLQSRFDQARDWYGRAVAKAAGLHGDIAVMRRQARRNLVALKQPRDRLDDVLPVPRVLAYCGHMVDAEGRAPPRFVPDKVGAVRRAIAEKLDAHGALHGFGSAACGTDLLFLEELRKRGRSATVVLPFPAEDFVATSVGPDWVARFERVRADPSIDFTAPLRPARPADVDLPKAFGEANREVLRLALQCAERLDETPVVIAVWDGRRGDGPGGTAETVALWKAEGYDVDVIDISKV